MAKTDAKGFTLIELMIAMAIGLIVLGGIMGSYIAQQQSRTSQQLVLRMQQGSRAALALMLREIRMANYDPLAHNGIEDGGDPATIDDPGESDVAGFQQVLPASVRFSLDLDQNGDDDGVNEDITYEFPAGADVDGDGVADAGAATLARRAQAGGAFQDLAFDIHAVAFAYAVDTDNDGALDTYGGGVSDPIVWLQDGDGDDTLETHLDTDRNGLIDSSDADGGTDVVADGVMAGYPNKDMVRAVRVWILARTGAPIRGHQETDIYVVGGLHLSPADAYKRMLMSGIAHCRNPF